LLTNNKPHAPADDYAFWKRLLLVPFTQSFVDDPQAPHEHKATKDLAGLLTAEAPGILNWAVAGCLEWQKTGLRPPPVVTEATQAYREEEDILLEFITDACEVGDNLIVGASALYNHYKSGMADNGMKPMSGTKFGRKMNDRFDRVRLADGNQYIGISPCRVCRV
jgi:putative DNA primase/helicase